MANYDFKSLSSFDFELLTRDLLQKKLNVFIESFKSGRDNGIDLRYSKPIEGKKIIIQCKHYVNSTFSSLKSSVRDEVEKLKKIQCDGYILVTSMGLTPNNKNELYDILKPYCKSTEDIIGQEDLNNLLNQYPDIEKQNYKLWLTSINLMEKILHNSVYNQSEIEIDYIKSKSKYYVQNKSFFEALKILTEFNYCIIAGIPGIGKTTLAEILLLHYLDLGYEICKITADIEEAYEVYKPHKKQVFYYDDFLGQTTLEDKLNKNEDDKIIKFISAISRSKEGKFILTTREYILNSAKIYYEKIDRFNFDINKCSIKLEDYTKFDKAKILFNHLYFSRIPKEFIKEFIIKIRYKSIINHRNYNPRIIEWMTETQNITNEDSFYKDFMNMLDNPNRIWEHIFNNQLSIASQNLLIVMVTMPNIIVIQELEMSFKKHNDYICNKYKYQSNRSDFNNALKQLEGNFINIISKNDDKLISYSNPSIKDFIESKIYYNREIFLDCINSMQYFSQIRVLLSRKIDIIDNYLIKKLIESFRELFNSDTITICNNDGKKGREYDKLPNRLIYILNKMKDFSAINNKVIIEMFLSIIRKIKFEDIEELIVLIKKINENYIIIPDFEKVVGVIANEVINNLHNIDYLYEWKIVFEVLKNFGEYFDIDKISLITKTFEDSYKEAIESDIEAIEFTSELDEYISLTNEILNYFKINDDSIDEIFAERFADLKSEEYEEGEYDYEDYIPEESYDDEDSVINDMFEVLV